MTISKIDLYRLLFAIFIAEGHVKASVPFGYLPLKSRWKAGKVSFLDVVKAVAREIDREFVRWGNAVKSGKFEGDFVRWLAREGYNANPSEWDDWEKNVRACLRRLP